MGTPSKSLYQAQALFSSCCEDCLFMTHSCPLPCPETCWWQLHLPRGHEPPTSSSQWLMDMWLQTAGPLTSKERDTISSVVWSYGWGTTSLWIGLYPSQPSLPSPACQTFPWRAFPKENPFNKLHAPELRSQVLILGCPELQQWVCVCILTYCVLMT